ncbi:retrovirus-related pol polyprotein from transposon TNT 1-94 [Tanacetum coccineum]|uniref:Retrovirus-related pol polyprotein from transposon TNT 1-94 n=1 Tax=Tanacetum coccineum TaxID=301880 RepID=A0ABQ5EJM9_9ASTR
MKEVFNEIETEVAKCSVERKKFKIKEKELLLENDHLLELIISQDLAHTVMNSVAEIIDYQSMEKSFLDEYTKDNSVSKLKEHIATLKGKNMSEGNKSENISKVITLRMYKLDLEPLSSKLLKNKEARVDYLKHTQENADTLRELVEQARELRPLDSDLDSTCRSNHPLVPGLGLLQAHDRAVLSAHQLLAVATACYTQSRSLIQKRHSKTPYELIHDRKLVLTYFDIFGTLCYPTNDSEDLGKLKPKADIRIFVGYATAKKAYRISNRWIRLIMETIHVKFDELTAMAFEKFGSGPEPHLMTPGTISS